MDTPTITTEQWTSELDRVAAMCGPTFIPEGRGFTVAELRRHMAANGTTLSEMTIKRRISTMLADGKIEAIGKRAGHGAATVYAVTPAAQPK